MYVRYCLCLLLWLCTDLSAAERIVTIGGAVTEIVYQLGAGKMIVANDTTSTYPESASKLPKVGYARTLSAEGILSLHPSLVLATAEAGPAHVIEQVRSAGVRVVIMSEAHTPESIARNISLIAATLGLSAVEESRRFSRQWQQAQIQIKSLPDNPRVLFILDHTGKSPMVAGDGTAASAMLGYARATNVMAGLFSGYKPLTAEAAIAAAPEVIVTTNEGLTAAGGLTAFLTTTGLALTPAGKNQRVVALDALSLLGFGPRMPETTLALSKAIRQ